MKTASPLTQRAKTSADRISRSASLLRAIASAAEYAVGFESVEDTCEAASNVAKRLTLLLGAEKTAVRMVPSKADVPRFTEVVEKMEGACAEVKAVIHGVRTGAWPNISAAESWREVSGGCDKVLLLLQAYAEALSGKAPEDDAIRH